MTLYSSPYKTVYQPKIPGYLLSGFTNYDDTITSLNDLHNDGINTDLTNLQKKLVEGKTNPYFNHVGPDGAIDARWSTDVNIQIANNAVTPKDLALDRTKFGAEQADGVRKSNCGKLPDPHGSDILVKTDYSPEYGMAYGPVTF